jgi:peptide/nickel transport system permease protein
MFNYVIRRLFLLVPTLIGTTVVVFFVVALTPGGIGGALLTREGTMKPEERRAREEYLKKRYGLNRPLPIQYLNWLNKVSPIGVKEPGEGFPSAARVGFKVPDLGESWQRQRPVATLIGEALPITLLLELTSLPLIYLISIGSGIRAARSRGKFADVGLGAFLIGLYSLPEIWIGVMMIGFLTNRVRYIHWFPSNGLHDTLADSWPFLPHWGPGGFNRGWLLDTMWHLVLPLVCLSYSSFAFLSRLTRGSLLETLNADYVRTARAKGLAERVVVYRHAFRNALMAQITVAANILPGLIAGAVIIETIFGLPGMGRLGIESVFAGDKELFMSITLIAGAIQLISLLLADLAYAVADPRVSYVD